MSVKKKVFIADDDQQVLDSLRKLLLASDFEVEATKNPLEVFARIKIFKPQVILLDLLMPNLGGLEICEMLNNDKETQGIPVIVISALDRPEDIKKAYHLGVIGYVTKPYDFSSLIKEINKAITYKQGQLPA